MAQKARENPSITRGDAKTHEEAEREDVRASVVL